jgi:hypothetical protein
LSWTNFFQSYNVVGSYELRMPFTCSKRGTALCRPRKGKGLKQEMINEKRRRLALFYCQNVPESREADRQALEEASGEAMALFPMPCSGRVEPVHLLRALEEFADAAYVITCP